MANVAGAEKLIHFEYKKLVLPWIYSALVVLCLVVFIFILDTDKNSPKDTLDVRSIEVAEIPPPEPPPARQQQTKAQNSTAPGPSIDLIGAGSGPALAFADNPKMAMNKMQQIEKPQFDKSSLASGANINVDFPLHPVEELDNIPKLISNNHISFPRRMRESGIDKVLTKVEIIIDAQGKAYVKKIVDPVYPEMIEVIRKAINDSRFTVPTKNGRPVQAVYLYNLTFINKV